MRRLAAFGDRYGVRLDPEPAGELRVLAELSEAVSDRLGRRSAPALLLLRDLRSLSTHAQGVSADWEMIAQVAQGIRDTDLLALAQRCHPQTLRQAEWANSTLKESATQAWSADGGPGPRRAAGDPRRPAAAGHPAAAGLPRPGTPGGVLLGTPRHARPRGGPRVR
ncbi:hypothetical protein [Geodermatophilus poikilotrophus]|uniref:Uncharacterized protein n=1 Tax=Geodermatophilus poikilotrophus TaxID=1333667 RepID=A0A1H9ZPF0_9ACTN|nr:hypothetical protein [Geodermatophilus poikilotrophus]SES83567.1 hypothetical protein SAMN04488546_0711 [Geodermatophilus poikilotrophus]